MRVKTTRHKNGYFKAVGLLLGWEKHRKKGLLELLDKATFYPLNFQNYGKRICHKKI